MNIGRWEVHRSIDCDGGCDTFSRRNDRSSALQWIRLMELRGDLPHVVAMILPGPVFPFTQASVVEKLASTIVSGGWHLRDRSLSSASGSMADVAGLAAAAGGSQVATAAQTADASGNSAAASGTPAAVKSSASTPRSAETQTSSGSASDDVVSSASPTDADALTAASTDQNAFAAALIAASNAGTPFCEICQQSQQQKAAA